MRKTRMHPIGIVTISLLAVVAGGHAAHAQEPDAAEPVEFSSRYAWSHQPAVGQRETLADGAQQVTAEAWQFRNLESSDPRFEGTLTLTDTLVTYPGGATVSVGAFRVENDGGAWQEVPVYWHDWDGQRRPGATWQRAFVGEDGYAGLFAIVVDTWRPDDEPAGTDIRLTGFIVEGELPSFPGPWSVG